MNDLNVIDRFMDAFIRYIDSGFGLLGGDVGFLTTVLIGIDITLAGLFWAMGGEDDIIGRFLKKILYVGAFALILNSFSTLADIIFRSFAGLGLTAGGGTMSAGDLLKPGKLAGTGFEAAWPRFAERYGQQFYRMWRYYLLACAGTFRARTTQLWQVVLSPLGVPNGYRRPA